MNPSNFNIENFAPDLSKIYTLSISTTTVNLMSEHLKQRSATNKISNVMSHGKNVNILIIWLMMWILGKLCMFDDFM